MMGRHELREQVFRLLFRAEFHSPEDLQKQMELFMTDMPVEDTAQETSEKELGYITERCEKVREHMEQLDKVIDDHTEGWDHTRMGKVELTVLRLGAFEILFDEDIPDSVAINEAIELAKKYGQETSGGFVNAILAKIMKSGESNS